MFKWLGRFKRKSNSPVAAAEITLADIALPLPGFTSRDSVGPRIYEYGIVQACIEKLAWTTGGLPWVVRNADGAIVDHQLMDAPNPDMTWHDFVVRYVLEYATSGDFYALLVRQRDRDKTSPVVAIWPMRSDLMSVRVDPNTGQVVEYIYGNMESVKRVRFPADEGRILHIRRPSIGGANDGSSITPNALRVAAVIEMLSEKLYEGLQGGATAPAIIAIKHALKEHTVGVKAVENVQQALRDHVLTGRKSGRVMVLGDVDVDKVDIPREAISPADMDTRTELRREVCFLLGIPPVLLGLKDDSTYNNYQTALKAFYTETILPMYAEPLAKAITQHVLRPQGLRLEVDVEEIPVLKEERRRLAEMLERSSFMTINEKRAEYGLPPVEGGDVVLQPVNMVPINDEPPDDPEEERKEAAEVWPIMGARTA